VETVNEWKAAIVRLGRFASAASRGQWSECRRLADEGMTAAGQNPAQIRWDEQIELNLAASHFGRGRETRMIGARMMHCPNNPRNGGDGCDDGDGTWRDRRWGR
jgi:hypothetical protein